MIEINLMLGILSLSILKEINELLLLLSFIIIIKQHKKNQLNYL